MFIKQLSAFFLSVVLIGFTACTDGENKDTNNDPVDSAQEVNDNRLADSVESDADYLVEAARLGMKEVETSKWAQKHATSVDAKRIAAMMVSEHTAMNKKVMALAKQKNIALPDSLPHDDMENIRTNDKKGADFDRDYLEVMVDDHEKTIDKFQRAADKSNDGDIKKLFLDAIPNIKRHLEMVKTAKDKADKAKDNNN